MREVEIVKVSSSYGFYGIKFYLNKIILCIPEFYSVREDKNRESDIIKFLNTLSLADKASKDDEILLEQGEKTKGWPINSYLWIIDDFLRNGVFKNNTIQLKSNLNAKIKWKETMSNLPIIENGNVFYKDLISQRTVVFHDLISVIYQNCLKVAVDRIGWIFQINIEHLHIHNISVDSMKRVVLYEISKSFSDRKTNLLNHLLTIIDSIHGDTVLKKDFFYGVTTYHYIFEQMIDSMYGNLTPKEKSVFFPDATWNINDIEKNTRPLRPDTIFKFKDAFYIVDAKFYRNSITGGMDDLPGSQSIQKQITYADYLMKITGISKIWNIFIIPDYGTTEILRYVGFAYANWRGNLLDYENIFAIAINLNFLVDSYKQTNDEEIGRIVELIEKNI